MKGKYRGIFGLPIFS